MLISEFFHFFFRFENSLKFGVGEAVKLKNNELSTQPKGLEKEPENKSKGSISIDEIRQEWELMK